MVKSFSCTNFRNVNLKDLEFAKVNLLIGPNNAGKSNLIRALSFAANMLSNASKDTSGFFAEVQRNGSTDILRRNSTSQSVSLGWRIALEGQDVDYTLKFHPGKGEEDSYIIKEAVDSAQKRKGNQKAFNFFLFHDKNPGTGMFSTAYQFGQENHRIHVPAEQSETALLQFEKLVMQNPDLSSKDYISKTMFSMLESMRNYFLKFYSYTSSKFDFEKIRQLQDPGVSGKFLTKDGSNLVNVYRYACKKDPDFQPRLLNKMKSMMRDLKEIKVEEGLDKIGMRLYFNNSGYMLSEVSDGTIEALLLALLTSMPQEQAPSLLAIDEPEVNLHPAWQAALGKWLQSSGSFKQCFVSTHSSDFLDSFTDGFQSGDVNIFVYDPVGRSTFKPLDRQRVNEELEKGWLLGDLYRVNDPAIGGWPW